MSTNDSNAFVAHEVPKAELHCHSDAVLDAAMLREIGREHVHTSLTPEALEAMCPATSWAHWMANYNAHVTTSLTPRLLLTTLERHVHRWRSQNVIYAELFVSGCLLLNEPIEDTVVLHRQIRETLDAASEGQLDVAIVTCIGRGPRQRAERQFARIFALREAGLICGLSIAGDEGRCTIQSIHDLLDRARESGMGIEIHAGETRGPESVREALEWGRPDRIGHGLAAFDELALVDEIGKRNIHLEFCPTSNRILTAHKDIRTHPIVRAHALGLSYSVNTDDPAPFGCSMSSEYVLLEQALGFDRADFDRILKQSIAAGFARR